MTCRWDETITALRESLASDEPPVLDTTAFTALQYQQHTGSSIAEAIGEIAANQESSEAVATLGDAMAAKSAYTREGAANALRSLAPKSVAARAQLSALLHHRDQGVRIVAESILAKVGRESP
jgi:hypothetical protein